MISYYYKYYLEIKNRLILLLFTWSFSLSVCYIYKETLLFTLINSSDSFNALNGKPYFIFTNVTEIFYVYLELSLFISNQIAILALFYQLLMFLSLGLYQFEFLKLKASFQIFIVSWFVSTILLYKYVIPFSWDFFLSFQQNSNGIQPISFFFEAKIVEYFNYFTNLYYICLLNCQLLAIFTFFLTDLSEKLGEIKTFRKLFYLIFVIFSTITTPPDIVTQVIISLFLIGIYEFLIFLKQLKINMATN
jgi:Sec-independent protein secretion pathway component TatC